MIVYLRFWMRKGKTWSGITIASEYFKNNPTGVVLFVTEKGAIPDINVQYHEYRSAEYISHLPKNEYRFNIINYESLHKINYTPDLIIIDECHRLSKFPKPAKAAEQLKKICFNKPVIFMSATPTPESFSQLFNQLWVSSFSPLARYHNFYRFADAFVNKQIKEYKGLPSTDYSDCNIKKLEPYIKHLFVTVREDEGTALLKVQHKTLYVDMSLKAIDIFNRLKNKKVYIDEQGRMATCNSGAEKRNKMLQICSGTLLFNETVAGKYKGDGEIIDTTKADFIRTFFFGKKIAIIFCYKAEERMLKMFFPNWTESDQEFNASNDKVFIKHIISCKTGTNLSTADAVIAITPFDSAEQFIQGSARMQHVKRTKPPEFYWIMSKHGIENEVLNNASNNKNEYTRYHYTVPA